jgi:L-threonylcarbamoyladenylate synthase
MIMLTEKIIRGSAILKKGGVIAFPTDTVYGIGADIFSGEAVERIYEIKKRSRHLPFPLLLNSISQLSTITDKIPELTYLLAANFWPGGLTLILPKANALPDYLSNKPTIAVRIPRHYIPLSLIQYVGNPITGTSANISGKQSALTADEVQRQLGDAIDYIIDGGECSGSNESTIIDLSGVSPVIVRQGIIPESEIAQVLNNYKKGRNQK